jgi:hypothetical protein
MGFISIRGRDSSLQISPPPQGFLQGLNLSGVRACLAVLVRRVLRVDGSGMKSHCASAPVPPEPLKLLWTAVTGHRFQSADMSAHSKGKPAPAWS